MAVPHFADLESATSALELVPVPAWLFDPEELHVVVANTTACEEYGYAADEFAGLDLRRLKPQEDVPALERIAAARPELRARRTYHVRRDGSMLAVDVSGRVVEVGRQQLYLVLAHDASTAVEAEERAHWLEAAIGAVDDGVCLTAAAPLDGDGPPIVQVNGAWERLTGYSAGESVGRGGGFVLHPDADPTLAASMARAMRDARPARGELLVRRKDGRPLWLETAMTPLRDQRGDLTHYVSVVRDVTDRHAAHQEALAASRLEAAGRLAGPLAHDFGNLLTIIETAAQLARLDIPEDNPAIEAVDDISMAAARARELTQRLLALSRQTVPEPSRVDVCTLLDELHPLVERLVGPDVDVEVVRDAGGPVRVDRTGLEQVLLNLVINARHAMPDGGKVRLVSERRDRWVELRVVDTGEGMPPEVAERATEPFFTTRPPGEGTGLGLATARHVAATAGGSLRIDSEPGRGTTVTLRLPALDRGQPA